MNTGLKPNRPRLVAQTASLPYRRIAFCGPPPGSGALDLSDALPIANRRYGRLKICATNAGSRKNSHAFTLLEVLLAVAIAVGMLAVLLFFYTQTANLRVQLFYETSKTSAARLLLDRLTTELTSARRCDSVQVGLNGGPDRIEFVRLDLPNSGSWTNSPNPALAMPSTPFHLTRYAALRALGSTNVSGLTRSEEPLQKRTVELPDESPTAATNTVAARRDPVSIDQFQFIRFRYWNGTAWLGSWVAPELPAGVQVSLGAEPLPEGTSPDEYPYELFRRTIYLPGHSTEAAANPQEAAITEEPR